MSISYNKTVSGLLYSSSFTNLNGWTGSLTYFTNPSTSALISFGPLPLALSNTEGGHDTDGVRNPMPFYESGSFYMLYDGGNPVDGWTSQWAISYDRGLSWSKQGNFTGFTKGSGSGIWTCNALGWLEKRNGTYFISRVVSDGLVSPAPYLKLYGPPYYGDVLTAPTIFGPWSLTGSLLPYFGSSSWAANNTLPGSIIKSGSLYYLFLEATPTGSSNWANGYASGSTPVGPWNINQTAVINSTLTADSRTAENPRVFYHPGLNKYGVLSNLINPPSTFTDQIALQLSNSLTDWSSASLTRLLRVCPLDGINTIGIATQYMQPDDGMIIGANGFMPLAYDNSGRQYTYGWHEKRIISTCLLEPSTNCLQYNNTAAAAYNIFQNVGNHTNFIAEWAVQFADNVVNKNIGIWYRADGTGNNGYRAIMRTASQLALFDKFVGGTYTGLTGGTGSMLVDPSYISRMKVVVSGSRHQIYLDGEKQVDMIDSSFASGSYIGIAAYAASGSQIRLLSFRTADTVTVTGLQPGTTAILRADGKLAVQATVADSTGTVYFNHTHYPLETFEIAGVDYTPTGGIWGGDTYTFSGFPSTATLTRLNGTKLITL